MDVRQHTRASALEAGLPPGGAWDERHFGRKERMWRRKSGTQAPSGSRILTGCTAPLPPGPLLTGLRAAAGLRAARAADVAAAAVWAALAPADAHQDEEEEDAQDHQPHKHPLWKDAQRNPRQEGRSPCLLIKRQTGRPGTEGTEPPSSGGTGE